MNEGRTRFLAQLRAAVEQSTLVKLTLGRHRGADPSVQNLFVRPVTLQAGPRFAFVWRHKTRDITKNHPAAEALGLLESLIGTDFLSAHLFTPTQTSQLELEADGRARLRTVAAQATPAPAAHDHDKVRPIAAAAGWLQALGVTNERGQPREGMSAKFRQIQKFAELLGHLTVEAGLAESPGGLRVVDMGSGKGYLTYAVSALLGEKSQVKGIEARPDLVDLCNRVATQEGMAARLSFVAGSIASTPLEPLDILIALHACDTATDDALAKGIAAGARLLIVSPCCQKEIRPQLAAPPVLVEALRHGIFQERQAEFVTDALRAQLLEWAGYRTKVFEFVSVEHTPKNLMIAAIQGGPRYDGTIAQAIRDFARFYGIKHQALAAQLKFDLTAAS